LWHGMNPKARDFRIVTSVSPPVVNPILWVADTVPGTVHIPIGCCILDAITDLGGWVWFVIGKWEYLCVQCGVQAAVDWLASVSHRADVWRIGHLGCVGHARVQ
jgi:hypothetical protein